MELISISCLAVGRISLSKAKSSFSVCGSPMLIQAMSSTGLIVFGMSLDSEHAPSEVISVLP